MNNSQNGSQPTNNNAPKTYTKAQVRWIALTTAAVVALGTYAYQKATFRPIVPNSITITNENPKMLAANMAFDPNSNQELINRISDVYVDALTKGIKNISIEQWMDFYTVLNINDIDPSDYARLQFGTKTKESIMRNFDFVNNTLLDDTITSTPSTIIDIASLVADKDSAAAIEELQQKIAEFNTSSSKTTNAKDLNKFVTSEFGTENYNQVDAASNLVRFKLLLAMEIRTINNSYRVPTADMSKIIFGKGEDCNLASKSTVNTKYNGEKTTVKEMLESKLEKIMSAKSDDSKISAIELLTGLEIEMKIKDKIAAMNAKYVANPSVEQTIIDSKPNSSTPSNQKVQPTDKIVTDKKTGETFIAVEPSKEEKEKQQQAIQDELQKENKSEELRAAGVVDGGQAGYDRGFTAGYNGTSYDAIAYAVSGDTIYREAYKESYTKQYQSGYTDGQNKRERENNQTPTVIIEPTTGQTQPTNNQLQTTGFSDGSKSGYTDGFSDGYNSAHYDDNIGNVSGDKAYRDDFKQGYIQQYKIGYSEGKNKLENERGQNSNSQMREAGLRDGGKEGYNDGFADGYNRASYNDNYGTVSGDKTYRNAYKESYTSQYGVGYNEGKKKFERETNNNRVNDNNGNVIDERYEAAPGYHYDNNGRLIDDSTGLPVITTSSRESTIEELKNLRVVAVNIKDANITISNEGKSARL